MSPLPKPTDFLRPTWPPSRGRAIAAVLILAVLLGGVVAITAGVLAGLTLFLSFSGVVSLLYLLLPARPRLCAELRGRGAARGVTGDTGLELLPGQTVRPIDIDSIVGSEEATARETMPRRPTPKAPRGAFGGIFELSETMTTSLESVSGASDEELRDFLAKVRAYGKELRAWLEVLETARGEALRPFRIVVRVKELGGAPADFARVRLSFPAAFKEPESPPAVPEPPVRPEFAGRFAVAPFPRVPRLSLPRGSLARLVPDAAEMRGRSAEYSSEDGRTVVDLNIGHINQGEYRDTAEFSLSAGPPGDHEVGWRISANGLAAPAEGTATVEVCKPRPGDPVTDLTGAIAEREHHRLD
jgi:hypothetical protein